MKLVLYPSCSTCKKAKTWLEAQGARFTTRDIKTENPTATELKEWCARSGQPLRRLFNTSGQLYRALALKDKLPAMSEDECFSLLATDGMLVRRPVLLTEKGVCFGFDEKAWMALL